MAKQFGGKSVPLSAAVKRERALTPVKKAAENPLSPRERQEIDDAVAFINERQDRTAISLIEIGEYLLLHFFEDDLEKVHDRAPRKGVSLRKLAEHPDVLMTYSQLSRAIALAVQEKQLDTVATLKHLTASHKLLLAGIDGHADLSESEIVDLKKKYAAQVEKEGLSVRSLHDLLIKDGYSKPRGLAAVGDESERKLLRSGFQSFVNPFKEIIELDLRRLFELPPATVKNAYDAAKKARERMDVIIKSLEAKMR